MKLILAAALVVCLAVPTYASIGNGPQEHPLEKFTEVTTPQLSPCMSGHSAHMRFLCSHQLIMQSGHCTFAKRMRYASSLQ